MLIKSLNNLDYYCKAYPRLIDVGYMIYNRSEIYDEIEVAFIAECLVGISLCLDEGEDVDMELVNSYINVVCDRLILDHKTEFMKIIEEYINV